MTPEDIAAKAHSDSFRVMCPSCGADSDAEGQDFTFSVPALPLHTDFSLSKIECLTCHRQFDICLWPVDHMKVIRSLASTGQRYDSAHTEVRGLLDRYNGLVERLRRDWNISYARGRHKEGGQHGMDLSQERVTPEPTRLTAANARVLAACRGFRKAVSAHPARDRVQSLHLGPFICALRLQAAQGEPLPNILHLAVSRLLVPGPLSQLEAAFLASLFFSPLERPTLLREQDQSPSVTHFRLPCTPSDAVAC